MKNVGKNKFFLTLFCLIAFLNCTANQEKSAMANQPNADENAGIGGKASAEENNSFEKNVENSAEQNRVSTNSDRIESIYTDLAADKCRTTSSNVDEGWSVQECPGVGIYKLEVTDDDLRQSINVIATSGDKWELDFPGKVSNAFSTFGDKAEWRVKKSSGKITPIALIARYNASENPENPIKITSYLVVTKISGEFICITDVVKPIPNANVKARELADKSADKPCLQPK